MTMRPYVTERALRPALPRQILVRSLWAAVAVLLLALTLGLLRMNDDIEEEVDAALNMAALMSDLSVLPRQDDEAALRTLRERLEAGAPRHLALQVLDARGAVLLQPAADDDEDAAADGPAMRTLMQAHRLLADPPDARTVAWTVARPQGAAWTVRLSASHDSERREALGSLLDLLLMLCLCVSLLLGLMGLTLRRAFAPWGALLGAISRIEDGDGGPVRRLPVMPTGELQALQTALRHLVDALDEAQSRRRALSHQLQSLQDDERARLARELHDEFGQQLTALRVDCAWLARRADGDVELAPVIASMGQTCARIQHDIRALLVRLRPFAGLETGDRVPMAELLRLLQALAEAWRPQGLQVRLQTGSGLPAVPDLPQDLALTLYRISQEALTNAARHARATQVDVQLMAQAPARPPAATAPARGADRVDVVDGADATDGSAACGAAAGWTLRWSVSDDGAGLPAADARQAMARGSGLAGLRERIWALGADLHLEPVHPGQPRPGLRLWARFAWESPAATIVAIPDSGPAARIRTAGLHDER